VTLGRYELRILRLMATGVTIEKPMSFSDEYLRSDNGWRVRSETMEALWSRQLISRGVGSIRHRRYGITDKGRELLETK